MSFVDARLLVLGALLGIGAVVAFAAEVPLGGAVAALLAVMSIHKAVRNYRKRPWGAPMSGEEKAAWTTRLVFEPACLRSGCGGPVVEFVGGRPPLMIRPFAVLPVDPALPDHYTQGAASCRRCGQRYTFTASHGSLSLRTPDEATRGSFEPLNA